jgi:hypothetical protein
VQFSVDLKVIEDVREKENHAIMRRRKTKDSAGRIIEEKHIENKEKEETNTLQ